ncbi:peptidase [Sphingomonas oleivorans]|uniref:Peptidase n=1 Tax=Sphingomonas oleivorans TaxID=1735121 RepID=A0A2T5FTH2_9SPHN|nr:M67 family metallopeptidase [Sphingomonas oleivorans]PTQ07363.1 peptidase [Sphingomonas oleivorans]
MAVRISSSLLGQIVDEARENPAREVCGLLFGRCDRIEAAASAANVAAHPADSFEIDPQALFAAIRAERGGGPRLIGHYHSHPNGSARPSARDAAAAEPGRYWLIVGGEEALLWRAEADGAGGISFRPMALRPE